MPARLHASPDDIDIGSLGGAIWRSLPRLAILSLLAGVGTFVALSMMTPRYTSEAQLKLSGKRVADNFLRPKLDNQQVDQSSSIDKEAVATEVIALRSRDLATRAIAELKLDQLPEFNPAVPQGGIVGGLAQMLGFGATRSAEREEEKVLAAYFRALLVYQGKDSRVINVEFSAGEPQLAADAANKIAELYRVRLAQSGAQQTQGASDFLAGQIARLTEELRRAEAEVEDFRAKAGLLVGGNQNVTLNAQQLGELSTELSRTQALRSEAEARAKGARDMLRRGSAEALPDVQKSALIPRLVEQRIKAERLISELSTTLLPGHPRMKQLQADLSGLNKQIVGEISKLVDSLEKEAGVAAMREASVKASLDGMKRQVADKSGDDVRLRSLEGLARSKRQELESLQANFESARARNDASAVPLTAELLSRARPSSIATFPKKPMSSAFATVATFILGLAFVITRELLAGGRRSGPALAPVPAPHAPNPSPDPTRRAPVMAPPAPLRVVRGASAATAPPPRPEPVPQPIGQITGSVSLADLCARLLERGAGQPGHRTLVTAAAETGDAGVEANEIAQSLLRSGAQVVLLDWNSHGRGIAAKLGLPSLPGISELLAGEATFEEVISVAGDDAAHFIPAGRPMRGPVDPDRINLILDALDEAYDQIIIHAERGEAVALFAAIQGRVDVGIAVASDSLPAEPVDGPGGFLGFEVTDIEVIGCDAIAAGEAPQAPPRRMQLSRGGGGRVAAG